MGSAEVSIAGKKKETDCGPITVILSEKTLPPSICFSGGNYSKHWNTESYLFFSSLFPGALKHVCLAFTLRNSHWIWAFCIRKNNFTIKRQGQGLFLTRYVILIHLNVYFYGLQLISTMVTSWINGANSIKQYIYKYFIDCKMIYK